MFAVTTFLQQSVFATGCAFCLFSVWRIARSGWGFLTVLLQRQRNKVEGLENLRADFANYFAATLAKKNGVKAWQGTRRFRVAAIQHETQDMRSFYLLPLDGKPLPRFEPGQFLTFYLDIPGRDRPLVRCYSLSERPREEYYRCTVKRVPAPAERPGVLPGLGSNFFHDRVREGDVLEVAAPSGNFFLDPCDSGSLVLIGSGVGITPVLSILNTLLYQRTTRTIYFFLGVRNSFEQPFKTHLEELAKKHENLKLHVCYSQPKKEDQLGKDYHHPGRVTQEYLQQVLSANNYDYYLCGPGPMMEQIVPAIETWGVPEERIHYEAFGPASIKKKKTGETAQIGPVEIDFVESGRRVTWTDEYESLLAFGEASGIELESGCRAGNCGQCLVAIRKGEVKTTKSPGYEAAENECLTCISLPAGPLELEA